MSPCATPPPTRPSAILVEAHLSRRGALLGGLTAAVGAMLVQPGAASAQGTTQAASEPMLGFRAVPTAAADRIVVPEGYTARVLAPWGTPINGSQPRYSPGNTGAEQGTAGRPAP